MKKIVTMGAIAVLAAGFIFADEPAADVSVTEFKGEAKVTWGMDLDAGKTGFKNTESANFKVKLFGSGDKITEGEDLWAELKIKTDGLKLENGEWKDGKASVDAAKIHFGDFFVGIRSGDVQVGAYKFDGAIRSADNDNAKWIADVGADKFNYGIEAGYDSSDLNVTLNFRSYKLADKIVYEEKDSDPKFKEEIDDTQYTNSYAVSLEAGLKDSNAFVPGLFVNAGFSYNLSNEYYHYGKLHYLTSEKDGKKTKELNTGIEVARVQFGPQNGHTLGYSFNAGYKLAIDDTYFVKPAVAFAGQLDSQESRGVDNNGNERWNKYSSNKNDLAFGVIFGWGANADANAGVPFLDGDMAKKVTPGVSVVVDIPFATVGKATTDKTRTIKTHDKVIAYIVPSVFTGSELVPNFTAGLYSEIALLQYKEKAADGYVSSYTKDNSDTDWTSRDVWNNASLKQEKFAFALAGGLKYDYKADEITVTPSAGFRFVNRAYVENKINAKNPLSNNAVFATSSLGAQDYVRYNSDAKYGDAGHLAGGFFNLKAGVSIGGLINNTTFSLDYESANLMNKIDYKSKEISVNGANIANPYYQAGEWKYYNVKLGHFDIGCKIAF